MAITLLPAVDVAAGRVARMAEGSHAAGTVPEDPRDTALRWQADGAEWIGR